MFSTLTLSSSLITSIGTVTLALTLMNLEKDCFRKLEESDFVDPIDPSIVYPKMYFLRGGGYLIYWVFRFSGCLVRAVIHWLTPLPGMGVGAFTFRLPEMGFNRSMSDLVHRMGDGIEEGERDSRAWHAQRGGKGSTLKRSNGRALSSLVRRYREP